MIWIAQFVSDMSFGMHVSSIFVYISYFFIFFFVSNFGHFISFNEYYSLSIFFDSYEAGIPFGINLMLSTLLFIFIYHALLAISNKQLVSSWLK
jgi:hypothetical protein